MIYSVVYSKLRGMALVLLVLWVMFSVYVI